MVFMDSIKDIRCCLIQLYGDLQPASAEPLSIEKLASALSHSLPDISVQLYTLGTFYSLDQRINQIQEIIQAEYDLIGLSCPQSTYEIACEVLSLLYNIANPPRIILGHALPTSMPEHFLSLYPHVFIVRGWGESSITMLCQQMQKRLIQPELIPGLTYIDEAGLRHDNPPSWSDPPAITRRITPERYFARVEASRGCHYNVCTFCSRPPREKQQPPWKRIDIRRILADIERLVQKGITTFTFTDEDFVGDDPHGALMLANELCRFSDLDFALSVRVDNIFAPQSSLEEQQMRFHIFETLKKAGLTLVFVGIESFALTQLQRFGKGTSPEINIRGLHLLETLNIELELGLILFDPLVTLEELQINIAILKQRNFWRYAGQIFSFLRPQIGTPYVTLLKRHELLGSLQVNIAEYGVSYQDPRVASVVNVCKAWNRQYNNFYMLLRNVNRSELGTGHFTQKIEKYRYIQLCFLENLLTAVDDRDTLTLGASHPFNQEIIGIARGICTDLQANASRTASENELYKSASRLL